MVPFLSGAETVARALCLIRNVGPPRLLSTGRRPIPSQEVQWIRPAGAQWPNKPGQSNHRLATCHAGRPNVIPVDMVRGSVGFSQCAGAVRGFGNTQRAKAKQKSMK